MMLPKHLKDRCLTVRRMLLLSLLLHSVVTTNGWVQSTLPTKISSSKFSLASEAADNNDVLGGVTNFEQWFGKLEKSSCLSSISHAAFGSLRGLTCSEIINEENKNILTVPGDIILSSSYANENWDVELAKKLWTECMKGSQSSLSGYCSLLSRGEKMLSNSVPPSAAPNALRHWTQEELDGLALSPNGKKLVKIKEKQEKLWRRKYQSLSKDSSSNPMSWEQFEWCLEVIHSRAFRGNYGLSSLRTILSVAAPLTSLIAGWLHIRGNPDYSDFVLLALGALAASPLIVDSVSPDKGEVVLLPMIDSANHLQEADSNIQYDPLAGVFSLAIGPNCLVQEKEGEKPELYVSYGPKTDNDLLLNYGFLPGVKCENESDEVQREIMAIEFLKRSI
mmetsp:Transcript_1979/g.2399  ORF Transcript_1979/g.2399 Transcript_1979/m.2399 type:complete len:392 (+) Transcript_1979:56-1231(+)|eukprot:CAMPEP_0194169950 /NCGR_PEP_ID=MMETSP0154-20130528/4607_1 /TAXON_ID=1049557 /ORGANISM="Thalassiothrix antarctica, Strain L6-D1" /LENGTH=391 /DNA_ID=CAMNT_0038881573 /DNA_START=40 /DNA_END=1215 /DNA_ORIENTATION=-